MNKDYTDITLVIDRSASMQNMKDEAESGINLFIEEQKKQQGKTLISLYQFDDRYEKVIDAVPIDQSPKYILHPRGMTALLDAVGKAIVETGLRLSNLPEQERPGLVVFVIVTDGHENCSQEMKKQNIREMIERQQNIYSWQFTFLGANQDAFQEGTNIGISQAGISNFKPNKVRSAWQYTSDKVCRMKCDAASGVKINNSYTDSELKDMNS